MYFRTFLKTGVEVLHLGDHHWQSDAWSIEHRKADSERWRLSAPAVTDFLNEELGRILFGSSIDLHSSARVFDFEALGAGVVFTGSEGFNRYEPKIKEILSVGRIEWTEVQVLRASQQIKAFELALQFSIGKVSLAKRKPNDFDPARFASVAGSELRSTKVSKLSRAAHAAQPSINTDVCDKAAGAGYVKSWGAFITTGTTKENMH